MSADNGVYILPVRHKDGKEEWRVEYHYAIDNITHMPNRKDGYNHTALNEYFGKSSSFVSKEKAVVFAHDLAKKHDNLEYGVVFLNRARGL